MYTINEEEIKNYLIYLDFIQKKLDKFFESQKPFIFCKKGCGRCCKNQQFPYTQIEMQYLLSGIFSLTPEIRNKVENNLNLVIKNKKEFDKKKYKRKKFQYNCPFLIDNVCCVYEYRGLICRSFGLMIKPEEGKVSIPFCVYEGLNYSNIMNISKMQFSKRKYERLKVQETPSVYHVGYQQLVDEDLAKGFGFRFGKIKSMLDWFIEFKENINND
jgi:Fe-S-cluster containining protein